MAAGRRVNAAQLRELRDHLDQGASLRFAAMKAGMDRKTARKYRDGADSEPVPHTWRTRRDPLAEVWPRLEELLQREAALQAKTLLQWLEQQVPEHDWQRHRRTLERRVRQWKAQHGPAKEVFFSQVHEPGRLGASDFTHMDSLGVTIQGQPFSHLLYHFVLTYSNWEYVAVCFAESFASLSAGLQDAWWELGGVPARHRTDRMSMAVHHEGNAEQYTRRYQALLRHYGVVAEATNPASGHENGDCEQGHRRFKEALGQELLLRGSREFASREVYVQFVRALAARRNRGRCARLAEEVARLGRLPPQRLQTEERQRVRVSQGSTIQVKKNIYSVPARLIGEWVEARIGVETIEVWYGGQCALTMERLRGQGKHKIAYRDVIDWLVRKPGAFARYVYREDLYPSVTYRRSYDALVAQQPERADREYVRLLQQAAQEGEERVAAVLVQLLSTGQPITVQAVRTALGRDTGLSLAAQVQVPAVDLRSYDALLEGASAAWSDTGVSQRDGIPEEVMDEQGRDGGAERGAARAAAGCDEGAVRSGGAPGDRRVVELQPIPARAGATRVPATAAQPHRATAEGLATAAGEELVGAGPEAAAGEGGAAVAGPLERRIPGPARERLDLWPAGLGQDARPQRDFAGAGAVGTARAIDQVQPAGAGAAQGEAGAEPEGAAARAGAVGGVVDRRPGLCAAEPGGDGSAVHPAGRALRAGERAGDEQPGILAVGADLQGPDDDRGGDRPVGASQRDRGAERAELPGRGGEADARGDTATPRVIDGNNYLPGPRAGKVSHALEGEG
jgi:Mu transposase-like protein